jgi:hypothetical protein
MERFAQPAAFESRAQERALFGLFEDAVTSYLRFGVDKRKRAFGKGATVRNAWCPEGSVTSHHSTRPDFVFLQFFVSQRSGGET